MSGIEAVGKLFRAAETVGPEVAAASSRFLDEMKTLSATGRHSQSELERLLTTRPIIASPPSPVPRDLLEPTDPLTKISLGYITDDQNRAIHVVSRLTNHLRERNELAGFWLHELSPYENYAAVTVKRPTGELVQERVGKSVFDRAFHLDSKVLKTAEPMEGVRDTAVSPTYNFLFNEVPEFRDQMEQAGAYRAILGFDGHPGNFGLALRFGHPKVAALDMEEIFGARRIPYVPTDLGLDGIRLSKENVDRTRVFAEKLDSEQARWTYFRAGLDEQRHVEPLKARARWLAQNGRFPSWAESYAAR